MAGSGKAEPFSTVTLTAARWPLAQFTGPERLSFSCLRARRLHKAETAGTASSAKSSARLRILPESSSAAAISAVRISQIPFSKTIILRSLSARLDGGHLRVFQDLRHDPARIDLHHARLCAQHQPVGGHIREYGGNILRHGIIAPV